MSRRFHWGYGIALVYITFAAATLSFVSFAIRHPPDLVGRDYYAQSLAHDDRQAARARAAALTPAAEAFVVENGKTLTVSLPPSAAAQGEIRLYRPARSGDDRVWTMALDTNGRQRLSTDGLPRGSWIVQLDWQAGGASYYAERQVILP